MGSRHIARAARPTRRSILLAVVGLAVAAAPASAVTGWTGPTIFGPADSCRDITAGLDANGKLHAAAECGFPSRIRYTTNASGSTITTYFAHPSDLQDLDPEMAIDGNRIYVAFSRVDQGCAIASTGVYMRSRTIGGAWSTPTMIAPIQRYLESFRVIAGKIHMTIFNEATGRLQYRTNATGAWQTFTIAIDSFFGDSSLRIDSTGKARVAYATDAGIKYATFTGGSPAFSSVTVPQTSHLMPCRR